MTDILEAKRFSWSIRLGLLLDLCFYKMEYAQFP